MLCRVDATLEEKSTLSILLKSLKKAILGNNVWQIKYEALQAKNIKPMIQ